MIRTSDRFKATRISTRGSCRLQTCKTLSRGLWRSTTWSRRGVGTSTDSEWRDRSRLVSFTFPKSILRYFLTLISASLCSVKPDATQEEIRAAYDDSQGGAQIFSQAVSFPSQKLNRCCEQRVDDSLISQLMQSRASGARAAFAEVQSRNQDLRKIEETITQLAQMMQDVSFSRIASFQSCRTDLERPPSSE